MKCKKYPTFFFSCSLTLRQFLCLILFLNRKPPVDSSWLKLPTNACICLLSPVCNFPRTLLFSSNSLPLLFFTSSCLSSHSLLHRLKFSAQLKLSPLFSRFLACCNYRETLSLSSFCVLRGLPLVRSMFLSFSKTLSSHEAIFSPSLHSSEKKNRSQNCWTNENLVWCRCFPYRPHHGLETAQHLRLSPLGV